MQIRKKSMLKKAVTLSIMLGLGAGSIIGMGSLAAAEGIQTFTQPITGSNESEYKDAGIKTGDNAYVFKTDAIISPTTEGYKAAGEDPANFSWLVPSILTLSSGSVTADGHTLTLTEDNLNHNVNGIYSDFQDVTVAAKTIDIKLHTNENKNIYGIHHSRSNSLYVNGNVNIDMKSPERAWGINSEDRGLIQASGGDITVNKDAKSGRTLYATSRAHLNFNYDFKNKKPGNQDVRLNGEIESVNALFTPQDSIGVINLGLTTSNSYLKGLSVYTIDRNDRGEFPQKDMGIVNMYLQNNAIWHNEQYTTSALNKSFTGSAITTLTGGATPETAGIIDQKDARPITVGTYAGHEIVVYQHGQQNPTEIIGGDFIVKKAAPNSGIVLRTGAENITKENKNDVLSNLAKKLQYKAFVSNEKNLSGKVEIAEGLTSSSAALYTGDMDFEVASGRGMYIPKEDTSVVEDSTNSAYTVGITGKANNEPYVKENIRQSDGSYVFTKDASITASNPINAESIKYVVNAAEHILTLEAPEGEVNFVGIKATSLGAGFVPFPRPHYNPATDITVKADKVVITGDVKSGNAVGIQRVDDGGKANINAALDIKLQGTGTLYGLDAKGKGIINTQNTTITIDKNAKKGAAIHTDNGIVNVNVVEGKAQRNTVKVDGDLLAEHVYGGSENDEGAINLAIVNKASYLRGLSAYTDENHEDGHFPYVGRGNVNLYLQHGGSWINEAHGSHIDFTGFTGSKVTTLTGGDTVETAGIIQQNDVRPITIDSYAGNTFVYYKHGKDPVDFAAGDTIIGKAKAGSMITLFTDSENIEAVKQAPVLESLAHKLYYLGAKDSKESNLTAKVSIAEGLTSPSKTIKIDTVKFNEVTGQGYVKDVGSNPGVPQGDVYDYIDPITNSADDSMYKRGGVLQEDGSYVFKENGKIEVSGKHQFAVSVGETPKKLVVNAGDHDLIISNNSTYNNVDRGIDIGRGSFEITAKNISSSVTGPSRVEAIRVEDSNATFNGDVKVRMQGSGYVLGAFVKAANATFNGTFTSNAIDGDSGYVKGAGESSSNKFNRYDKSNIYAGNGAVVNLNGAVDIGVVKGAGIVSNQGGSVVNINKGGSIKTIDTKKDLVYALNAQSSKINANMNAENTDAGTNKFVMVGNAAVDDGAANVNEPFKNTVINIGLGTVDSVWTGAAIVDFKEENIKAGNTGAINLYMKEGSTWTNKVIGQALDTYSGSTIERLKAEKGIINQEDEDDLTIKNLEGDVLVTYAHDAATPTTFDAGKTIVTHAEPNANVTLRTDAAGIDMSKVDAANGADKVLEALATKITYENYADSKGKERNLTGKVEIAEGLTSSSLSKKVGNITFNEETGFGGYTPEVTSTVPSGDADAGHGDAGAGHGDAGTGHGDAGTGHGDAGAGHGDAGTGHGDAGTGHGDAGTGHGDAGTGHVDTGTGHSGIEEGNQDTAIMKGVRAGLVSPIITIRQTMNDVYKRLGDIRYNTNEEGAWALVGGGKASYSSGALDSEYSYHDIQVGYDTTVASDWKAGLMFQHIQGDTTGTHMNGKAKSNSFGLYGTKLNKDGRYTDIITKYGKVSNDVIVDNGEGIFAKGTMDTTGVIVSAEHGKRINHANGYYVEPQVEFTYMHVNGGSYGLQTNYNNGTTLFVKQDAYNSLVGRLGYAIGYKSETGSAYAKLSVSHEFMGHVDTTYVAAGQPTKTIGMNLKDTWATFQLGATRVVSNNAYVYGNVLTTFGGDYKDKWKANVGVRLSF